MSRITGLEKEQASWLVKPVYNIVRKMFGKDLTPIKVQARRPGILWASNFLGLAVDKSKLLRRRMHVLVQLRTAQCVGCPF